MTLIKKGLEEKYLSLKKRDLMDTIRARRSRQIPSVQVVVDSRALKGWWLQLTIRLGIRVFFDTLLATLDFIH